MDTEGIRRSVAARLAELQWSRARLARESGVDPNTISDFLNGKRQPSSVTLAKLESALGLTHGTPTASGEDSPPPEGRSSGFEYEWIARRPTAMGKVSVTVTLDLLEGADRAGVQSTMGVVVQEATNALLDAAEAAADRGGEGSALDVVWSNEVDIVTEPSPVTWRDDVTLAARRTRSRGKQMQAEADVRGEESQDHGGEE